MLARGTCLDNMHKIQLDTLKHKSSSYAFSTLAVAPKAGIHQQYQKLTSSIVTSTLTEV